MSILPHSRDITANLMTFNTTQQLKLQPTNNSRLKAVLVNMCCTLQGMEFL